MYLRIPINITFLKLGLTEKIGCRACTISKKMIFNWRASKFQQTLLRFSSPNKNNKSELDRVEIREFKSLRVRNGGASAQA